MYNIKTRYLKQKRATVTTTAQSFHTGMTIYYFVKCTLMQVFVNELNKNI